MSRRPGQMDGHGLDFGRPRSEPCFRPSAPDVAPDSLASMRLESIKNGVFWFEQMEGTIPGYSARIVCRLVPWWEQELNARQCGLDKTKEVFPCGSFDLPVCFCLR
jgi:hypothetical protein